MKLSVDDFKSDDPERAALAYRCQIFLDGVPIYGCLEANEEEGYVVIETSSVDADEYFNEKLFGEVKIIDPKKGIQNANSK